MDTINQNQNNPTPTPATSPVSNNAILAGAPTNNAATPRSGGLNAVKVILIAVAISSAITAMIVALLVLLVGTTTFQNNRATLYEHEAYFVPESTKSGTKYALIDRDGNFLTDFEIEEYSSFLDGYAIIKNTDGWGIINDSGEMTIKPNEYDGLKRVGGLYVAFKPGSSKHKLIQGSGRVITSYSTVLNSELGRPDLESRNAAAVVIQREKDIYDIYNARGKYLETAMSKAAPFISTISSTDEYEEYLTAISYDGGLIIIKNNTLEEVLRANESRKNYRLLESSDDLSQITLVEESKNGFNLGQNMRNYAIVVDGNFYDIGTRCQEIGVIDSEMNPAGYIECSTEDGDGFFDDRGELHLETDYDKHLYNIPLDYAHYATYNSRTETANIGNRTLKSVDNIYINGNHFLVRSGTQKTAYDASGEKICSLPDNVLYFGGFDRNGVGIARFKRAESSSVKTAFYSALINQQCRSISKAYSSITSLGNYYVATSNFGNNYSHILIDKTGEERHADNAYNRFRTVGYRGKAKEIIAATRPDGKNTFFDADLREVASFSGSITYDNTQDYLKVTDEKYITFYTLNGTKIYSVSTSDGASSRT